MRIVTVWQFESAADMKDFVAAGPPPDPFRAFTETTANIDGGSKGAFRKLMDLKARAARLLKGTR